MTRFLCGEFFQLEDQTEDDVIIQFTAGKKENHQTQSKKHIKDLLTM